jgi:hypothetical protein
MPRNFDEEGGRGGGGGHGGGGNRGGSRGRGRGGGRGGMQWINKPEPKFIREFKERIAYKEKASLDDKVKTKTINYKSVICSNLVNQIKRKRRTLKMNMWNEKKIDLKWFN